MSTPPDQRRWSGADLLDLPANLGQRVESVRFDILNYDLTYAFTATHVDRQNPPSIQFDANSEINRTLTGLKFGTEDADRINPLTHLVYPQWALDDGTLWPMGVFHFADTPLNVASWGDEFTPSCYDRSVVLTQGRAGTFTITTGTSYVTAARQIVAEVGLSTWTAIDQSAVFATAPQTFKAGTSRKAILGSICQSLGWYPPYFDNDGFLRLRAVPNPISDADPDVVYTTDGDSRVLRDSVKLSSNIAKAPNVYRVVGSPSAGGEVVGEFRVPDSAPHSVARRGFEIVVQVDAQGVQDQQAAQVAAHAAYVNDFSTHVQLEFATAPDPRADGMQIVRFQDVNYREQSWGMELAPGGAMAHVVQEVWVP